MFARLLNEFAFPMGHYITLGALRGVAILMLW